MEARELLVDVVKRMRPLRHISDVQARDIAEKALAQVGDTPAGDERAYQLALSMSRQKTELLA